MSFQDDLNRLTEEKAALERQLEETKRPCHRSHPHEDDPGCPFNSEVHVSVLRANAELRSERDAALAESRKLQGEVLAAVALLKEIFLDWDTYVSDGPYIPNRVRAVIDNTSATAQETVQRIEREALEKAWQNVVEAFPILSMSSIYGEIVLPANLVRAAILGEKEE